MLRARCWWGILASPLLSGGCSHQRPCLQCCRRSQGAPPATNCCSRERRDFQFLSPHYASKFLLRSCFLQMQNPQCNQHVRGSAHKHHPWCLCIDLSNLAACRFLSLFHSTSSTKAAIVHSHLPSQLLPQLFQAPNPVLLEAMSPNLFPFRDNASGYPGSLCNQKQGSSADVSHPTHWWCEGFCSPWCSPKIYPRIRIFLSQKSRPPKTASLASEILCLMLDWQFLWVIHQVISSRTIDWHLVSQNRQTQRVLKPRIDSRIYPGSWSPKTMT